jgi:hypothetical protein
VQFEDESHTFLQIKAIENRELMGWRAPFVQLMKNYNNVLINNIDSSILLFEEN